MKKLVQFLCAIFIVGMLAGYYAAAEGVRVFSPPSSGGSISPSTVTIPSGTGSACFSADNPTLVVNCATHRVGVGTANPSVLLDVSGLAQVGSSANASFPLTIKTDGGFPARLLGPASQSQNVAFQLYDASGFLGEFGYIPVAQALFFGTDGAAGSGLFIPVATPGRIGINTAMPATALHMSSGTLLIDGTAPGITLDAAGGNTSIQFRNRGAFLGNIGYVGSPGTLYLGEDGSQILGVSVKNATVGINTQTPSTALSVYGVITSSTTQGTVACNAGTGVLSAAATDQHGTFTAGTGAANCTVTFRTAWPKTPDCICADDSSILAIKATATMTTLQCAAAVTMSGDTMTYMCMGAP